MRNQFLLCVFIISIEDVFSAPEQHLYCAHLYNKVAHITIEQPEPDAILDLDADAPGAYDGKTVDQKNGNVPSIITSSDGTGGTVQMEKCSTSNFCYALWQTETTVNGTNTVIMGQGCWAGSNGKQDCERNECISDKKPPKAANNTKFCCCSGNSCNVNFTDAYIPVESDLQDPKILAPATEFLEQSRKEHQKLILIVVCVFLMTLIGVGCAIFRFWRTGLLLTTASKAYSDSVNLNEGGPRYANGFYSVDHLKLCAIVGQGRYGSVWKGTVNEQDVAVKIFPAHYRNYYYNERDIYCLPLMENPAVLTYFGCDERTNLEGHIEYLLVLSYAPNGCLQDYLRENTLDWPSFCKMTLSVAKGLAHLHTDIISGDKVKPCVSHRDLNTRNILVKADLSCCLCDLGFAMKISGSKYYHNGEEQHAETKSINEVGTLRYMAPEVLEGAVNLRDCESSLKQIDVYALGLVLWELSTRCVDLYPSGVEVPAYKLPFENEVGLHPTFEQMQSVVSRHKARPLWPPEAWNGRWGCTPTHRLVRDTTEDCWDQDAEARLTALCVEERLHELPQLKDRGNRATIYTSSAVSPTLNLTQIANPSIINNNHLNSMSNGPNISSIASYNQQSTGGNSVSQPSCGKDMSDMSEGTVETMYTMSPSEAANDSGYKNSNQAAQYAQQQHLLGALQSLQPFQGRNPCLERNLLMTGSSSEDLPSSNVLIDKSFKHTSHYRANSETQGLLGHDFLNQTGANLPNSCNTAHQNGGVSVNTSNGNRPATPIPYVQNVVYDAHNTSYATIPKTQNTSGNNCGLNSDIHGSAKPATFGWNGFKRLIDRKLFGRERLDAALVEESEVKSNLLVRDELSKKAVVGPVVMETQVNLVPSKIVNGFAKQNTVITSVLNEDSISSTQRAESSKRPSTLPLTVNLVDKNCEKNMIKTSPKSSGHKILIHNESNPTSHQKFTIVPPLRQSVADIDNIRNSIDGEDVQLVPKNNKPVKLTSGIVQVVKRRKSLTREPSLEQFNEVFSSTSDLSRLKDPNQRIKTPGDVPPSVRRNRGRANSSNSARFSLYDDRMMSITNYDDGDCEQLWSNSVPDGIGVSIYCNNSFKPNKVENLVITNRTDSVSSF